MKGGGMLFSKARCYFRFWLSDLLFIRIFKREPVAKAVKETKESVEWFNTVHGDPCCENCSGKNLTHKIKGSYGVFQSTYEVWFCRDCENEQRYSDGSTSICLDDKLKKKGVVEDGDGYRYRFLPGWLYWTMVVIIFMIAWIAFGKCVLKM